MAAHQWDDLPKESEEADTAAKYRNFKTAPVRRSTRRSKFTALGNDESTAWRGRSGRPLAWVFCTSWPPERLRCPNPAPVGCAPPTRSGSQHAVLRDPLPGAGQFVNHAFMYIQSINHLLATVPADLQVCQLLADDPINRFAFVHFDLLAGTHVHP